MLTICPLLPVLFRSELDYDDKTTTTTTITSPLWPTPRRPVQDHPSKTMRAGHGYGKASDEERTHKFNDVLGHDHAPMDNGTESELRDGSMSYEL